MFKRMATDLDTQPTMTQQRLTCPLKSPKLLPDGCCCLSDTGNDKPLQNQNLTVTYNHRWFGRGGPIAWPLRSPKLAPMDFFLWGHIKALIYMSPFDLFSRFQLTKFGRGNYPHSVCIYLYILLP